MLSIFLDIRKNEDRNNFNLASLEFILWKHWPLRERDISSLLIFKTYCYMIMQPYFTVKSKFCILGGSEKTRE